MQIGSLESLTLIWGPLSEEGRQYLPAAAGRVLVPENRPYLFGLKHNIPLLRAWHIPFVYCTDNMLGHLFYKRKIERTVIFYKEKTPQGLRSLSGSLYVWWLSRLHRIPLFYCPAGQPAGYSFDEDASTLGGKAFVAASERAWVEPAQDELIRAEV